MIFVETRVRVASFWLREIEIEKSKHFTPRQGILINDSHKRMLQTILANDQVKHEDCKDQINWTQQDFLTTFSRDLVLFILLLKDFIFFICSS
jgi:hypothetical protein